MNRQLITTAGIVALAATLAAQGAFPKANGYVNDYAGVLSAPVRSELDARLRQVEQQTSSEIAVAIVKSLDGMSVEEYANKLFKAWGVGQARTDNGVLILVAPAEQTMRIEVGYGLEGVLPDGLAGEVIREEFLPRFKQKDYDAGVRDGVLRVAGIVERHQVLTPEELARFNDDSSSDAMPTMFVIPFLSLFIGIGFAFIGIGFRTKTVFPLLFGGLFGGLPLLLALGLLFSIAAFTVLPLAVLMMVVGYRLGGRPSWQATFRSGSESVFRGGAGDGWVMGGNSGSSSDSGSSSSSSSDSSGGGSSGGGGASGSW